MREGQGLLAFMLCGSYSSRPELNPYAATSDEKRQQILLLINRDPLSVSQLARKLGLSETETAEHLAALQRCGLVEKSQGNLVPTFPIFTAEDQEKLYPWVHQLAGAFADLLEARLDRIHAVYEACSFPRAGFSFEAINYILVAAYIFDYGGLWALARAGLLKTEKEMPGGRYVFSAMERGVLAPQLRASWRWTWGHADSFDKFTFCSHGQLPSTKSKRRTAFPDLARGWREEGRAPSEIERTMRELGEILLALYEGSPQPLRLDLLTRPVGITPERVAEHVRLLGRLGYVEEESQGYRTACPVLYEEDSRRIWALVEEVQGELISRVLQPNWSQLERLYRETAPYRQGIALAESFNSLYHILFDHACQRLLERGTISPPREHPDGARYAVWIAYAGSPCHHHLKGESKS